MRAVIYCRVSSQEQVANLSLPTQEKYCRKHKDTTDAVVVYTLTRFSRNSTDHYAIGAHLRGLGIALRSVTEPIDDSPAGRLMEGIRVAMSQFDNEQRAERTR